MMNLHKMRRSFGLRSLIIYVTLVWLLQADLVGSANRSSSTSLNASTNPKLTKPTKLKSSKKALNKSLNKPFRNATALPPASLSPVKLTKHLDEETPKTLYQISRDGRHQMLAFGSEITLAYQTQQLVFEEALLNNAFNSNSSEANEIETSAQESIPFFFNQNAMCPKSRLQCFQSKFRTADGSCNNLRHPRWGKSFECYKRMMNPDFADNFLMPRNSITGQELPNPRFISMRIHTGRMVRSKDVSNMFAQFGQFMDHDSTQTPLFRTPNGNLIDCCNGPDRFRQDRCAPIQLSRNDNFYTRFGISCLNFVRSSPCLTCSQSPRTQLNQLTSFIDASNIYGSLLNHTNALRLFDGTGRLRMSRNELLPPSLDMRTDQCSRPPQSVCFGSGDSRVNLTPGLVSMHTIFHRQHNSMALALKRINPQWDDERLFQETRRIIGAQMQMITYNEFVPLVIGPKRMNQFNLNVQSKGYTKYNPDINPTIYTEFASAAFRFGHTLISPVYTRMESNGAQTEYWLKDNYFNSHVLKDGELDNILRGMTASNAARTDPFIADDVRNHLYRRRQDGFGSDLIAFNIARGREHGIPGYIHVMRLCFNEKINNFEQLDGYMPRQQRLKLQSMYAQVNDIDLFTGGISEFPMPGGHVGPTFACVISKQFADLKFGDRYYFEHGGESGSFTPAQLDSIRQTTLAKVICDNGDDFGQVSSRAMELITDKNPVVPCNSLPRLDLNLWKEN